MNIFIIGSRFAYPETMSLFLDNAFKSLGHTTAGYCERTGSSWPKSYVSFKPDLLLVIKGKGYDNTIVPRMKERYGCKTILYFPDPLDDGDNDSFVRQQRKLYDYLFLACWYPQDVLDVLKAHWLPVAYDHTIHHSRGQTVNPHIHEVVFVGTKRNGREWIGRSAHATWSPIISIYGNEWNKYTKDVYLDEKCGIYQNAKIILNHHYLAKGPNHRFFEVLAVGGGMLLSDVCPGMEELGFQPDRDFAYYVTPDDAISKIEYYLHNPEEMKSIIQKGAETVKPHTFQARMKKLLEVVA